MKINRKIIIVIYFLVVNISYAWFDDDFNYCRELELNEKTSVPRNFETVDIHIDTLNWSHKPFENSTRLVTSGCFENGTEIPSQLYNKTLDEGLLEKFNLVFEASLLPNETKTYSLYYSTRKMEIPDYDSVYSLRQYRSWWLETDNYNIYYSLRQDEGITDLRYVKNGDYWTNYAGYKLFRSVDTPLSILQAGPKNHFHPMSTGPVCFIYERKNLPDHILCKICKNSEYILCENLGNRTAIGNHIRSSIFYDSGLPYDLYHRTNVDDSFKPSNSIGSKIENFRFGVANTTANTNFITVVTNGSPEYTANSWWNVGNGGYAGQLLLTNPENPWRKALVLINNESFDKAFEKAQNLSLAIDSPLEDNYFLGPEENNFPIILDKPLIITNYNRENYISAVLTGEPVLIYEKNRDFIDYFIEEYQPNQIFQLGTNISLNNSYFLDSADVLEEIFPKITFKQPRETNYIILSNAEDKKSMFSIPIAIEKNGFIINSTGTANEMKEDLVNGIKILGLPESYIFDKNIFLLIVGAPKFLVNDSLIKNEIIYTDTPYGDVNGDEYLDLSVGRISGSPESISFQIEYSKLIEKEKTALILSSYNMPGKYFDVMTSGGAMSESWKTELGLLRKGFDVTKIVEKRSEFDELNLETLKKIGDISRLLGDFSDANYTSFLGELASSFNKIIILAKVGDFIIYSLYEFDWTDSWESLVDGKPRYPKHLPILNETNVLGNAPKNQIIAYYSKGNATHWFLPLNTTLFSTYYGVFDPSSIDFNPSFYYLKYDESEKISDKIFDIGSIGMVTMNAQTSNLHTGKTATLFFDEFDKPVGEALKNAKNWNLKVSNTSNLSKRFYKREYYINEMLGDPSLTFNNHTEIVESIDAEVNGNTFTVRFTSKPKYKIVEIDGEKNLIFDDVEDEIITESKLVIPVYRETFILPTNSKLLDVNLVPKKIRKIENVFIDSVGNETFFGQWPETNFWNYEIKLLDNRTDFNLMFTPVVYYENNTAGVFEEIEFTFNYISPIEIVSLGTNDIYLNEDANIDFSVFSNFNESIKLTSTFLIGNEKTTFKIKKEYSIDPGPNNLTFVFNETGILGNYYVTTALNFDDFVAGPKYSDFKIKEKTIIENFGKNNPLVEYTIPFKLEVTQNFDSFLKKFRTYNEAFTVEKTHDKLTIDYKSIGKKIHIEEKEHTKVSSFEHKNQKLKVIKSPGYYEYIFESPDGLLVIKKKNGFIEKYGVGDINKLEVSLSDVIDFYELELKELENRLL